MTDGTHVIEIRNLKAIIAGHNLGAHQKTECIRAAKIAHLEEQLAAAQETNVAREAEIQSLKKVISNEINTNEDRDLPIEEWKEIKGYEGKYLISTYGTVAALTYTRSSIERLRDVPLIKATRTRNDGRLVVNITNDGKTKTAQIHVLVAQAFIGDCPVGMSVLHKDGNHLNNHISNLYYGTLKQNQEDSRNHGTMKGTPIIGFHDNGNFVIYDRASEAKADGFAGSAIFDSISGRKESYAGHVWMRLGKASINKLLHENNARILEEAAHLETKWSESAHMAEAIRLMAAEYRAKAGGK